VLDPEVLTRSGTVLLDTARPDGENRVSWCFSAPERVLTASSGADVAALTQELEGATRRGRYVAGCLSYEAGYPFVELDRPSDAQQPVAWFGVYESPTRLAPGDVDAGLSTVDGSASVHDVAFGVSREEYLKAVSTVRRHIGKGDVYQINYTAPLYFELQGDPRVLYRRLRARQHVPYGAYLNLGSRSILSLSPELFFRRDGDRVIARPMKGTIRRGRSLSEDRRLRDQLQSDPKNRAENLMIVDLLRNDLSVCCRLGSVTVPSMFETTSYETVTQMTSTVEGRLREGVGLPSLLRALFPCGSVTGAPKRRAMRLIRQLERAPRGAYCGAIGMAAPDGTALFSVAIRTVELDGTSGKMGVGSGIVWDSDPEAEYEESRLKGTFLTGTRSDQESDPPQELKLIETMRHDENGIRLLERHVNRLADAATYFSFPFDEHRFRRRVDAETSRRAEAGPLKVRVTLDRWGRLSVSTTQIESNVSVPWRLTIADERVDPTDPYFYHKTTRRAVYDRALEAAREDGYDEAVLLNENGEVTEGTYTNIFIRRGDELWTPPVESGLLAGVYRDHVLEGRPEAKEHVITVTDLQEASEIYCCNAVRGWCAADLHSSECTQSVSDAA